MPTHVTKGKGRRPYKIREPGGKIVGTSKTRKNAEISSWKRSGGGGKCKKKKG